MKLSQLIEKLQAMQVKHGDVEVWIETEKQTGIAEAVYPGTYLRPPTTFITISTDEANDSTP